MSPHLQVYRPQLTSILSITHRVTGLALGIGSIVFVWQLVDAARGPAAFSAFQSFIGSWFGLALLLAWSAAFFFHLANGVRHLLWDAGYGYDLPTAYRTGTAVLVATAALTVLTWIIAVAVWKF
jgi:succinate dehydrogenase / fumarate reductase cytochrome b subunit